MIPRSSVTRRILLDIGEEWITGAEVFIRIRLMGCQDTRQKVQQNEYASEYCEIYIYSYVEIDVEDFYSGYPKSFRDYRV
ncbi:hypothetical protein ASZ90_010022 [hydrocarbon metagenome]|uniref:Uncharacterized protein n=1 Tax=hydrocarbon metagenome TaxID=938273 RepID=A0A0W8FHA9_9ZZZZ